MVGFAVPGGSTKLDLAAWPEGATAEGSSVLANFSAGSRGD